MDIQLMGLLQAVVHQCVYKSGIYGGGGRSGSSGAAAAAAARPRPFKRTMFLGQPYYRCEVQEVQEYIRGNVHEAVHTFLGPAQRRGGGGGRGGGGNRVCEMVVAFLDQNDKVFTRCILRPEIVAAGKENGRGVKPPQYETMMRAMLPAVFSGFTALEPKSFRRRVADSETIAAHRFQIVFYISEDAPRGGDRGGRAQLKLSSRSNLVEVSESERKQFEFEAQPELQKYRNAELDDDAAEFLHYPIKYSTSGVFGFSGGVEVAREGDDDEGGDVLMGAK
jgi:hypothetical protein